MATRKTTSSKNSEKTTPKTSTSLRTNSPVSKLKLKNLIFPLVIIVIAVAIWVFKNQFIVATVNGQPVTRLAIVSELEKKYGKNTLEALVTEQLIIQEAQKRKINVSEADIKKEITSIEKTITGQGQNLEMVLAQQGMTRDDLTKQVKLQLILKKMVGKIEVTTKEIDKYITDNKESIPAEVDPATVKGQIKSQLEQQKLGEKISAFISNLQKKAKIEYWKNY